MDFDDLGGFDLGGGGRGFGVVDGYCVGDGGGLGYGGHGEEGEGEEEGGAAHFDGAVGLGGGWFDGSERAIAGLGCAQCGSLCDVRREAWVVVDGTARPRS